MTVEQDIPGFDVRQEADGSFQIVIRDGIDVVFHGGLAHPTFDVSIRGESTRIVYGDANPVPYPYKSVLELKSAIAATPVMFAHEAGLHVMKRRANGQL